MSAVARLGKIHRIFHTAPNFIKATPLKLVGRTETEMRARTASIFKRFGLNLTAYAIDHNKIDELELQRMTASMRAELTPVLEAEFIRVYKGLGSNGENWKVLAQGEQPRMAAEQWGEKNLVKQTFTPIQNVTRDTLQKGVDFLLKNPGKQNYAEALLKMDPAFSDFRAVRIAVTEATRARSSATREFVNGLTKYGYGYIAYWNTYVTNVCPICEGLDGKVFKFDEGDYPEGPPAHPNCRCKILVEEDPNAPDKPIPPEPIVKPPKLRKVRAKPKPAPVPPPVAPPPVIPPPVAPPVQRGPGELGPKATEAVQKIFDALKKSNARARIHGAPTTYELRHLWGEAKKATNQLNAEVLQAIADGTGTAYPVRKRPGETSNELNTRQNQWALRFPYHVTERQARWAYEKARLDFSRRPDVREALKQMDGGVQTLCGNVKLHLGNGSGPTVKAKGFKNALGSAGIRNTEYLEFLEYSGLIVSKSNQNISPYTHGRGQGNDLVVRFEIYERIRSFSELAKLHLQYDLGRDIFVHEMGHQFESAMAFPDPAYPGVVIRWVEAANEFRKQRWAASTDPDGNTWRSLKILNAAYGDGYDASEKSKTDDFTEAYIGKDYGGSATDATEVISSGLERLINDPATFYATDPDYFRFIVSTINGETYIAQGKRTGNVALFEAP